MLPIKRIIFLLVTAGCIFSPACMLTAQVREADTIGYAIAYDNSLTQEATNFNLMMASIKGIDSEIIRLIHEGADINAVSDDGITPLAFAVANNHLSSVKTLLNYGPDLDKETGSRETPLIIAVKNQNSEIAETLIRAGADIDKGNYWFGATALHYASIYGSFEMTDLLLYYDADADIKTSDGTTPLMAAVWSGYPDVADLLIQNGANMEAKDNDGYTPFLIAARNGDTLIMNILLKEGVDLYEKNNYNYNALDLAIESDRKEAVEMLLEKGDKWTSPEKEGISPYKIASVFGEKEYVSLLEKKKVPGKAILKIEEISVSTTAKFTMRDFYNGINISFREPLIKAGFFTGCDVKLWYSKVLMQSSENVFYQYLDKSSIVYTGVFKDFSLSMSQKRSGIALTTSVAAAYSFGNKLKGTNIAPDDKFMIIPAAGIKLQIRRVNFTAGLEYMKSEFYNNGPLWFRAGCSYTMYIHKIHSPGKTIKWL